MWTSQEPVVIKLWNFFLKKLWTIHENLHKRCLQVVNKFRTYIRFEKVVSKSQTSHEQIEKKFWKNCEKVISVEQVMSKLWTTCENIVKKLWTSHEIVVNKSWKYCYKDLNKLSTSHKQGENKLWTSHKQGLNKLRLLFCVVNMLWTSVDHVPNKLWTNCE